MYLRHAPGIESLNVCNENALTEDDGHNTSATQYEQDADQDGDGHMNDNIGGVHVTDSSSTVDCCVDELMQKCVAVEELVRNNIEKAQQKQCKNYAKKQKGVKVFAFSVGDRVMKLNARKRSRKGDTLATEWLGPYTLSSISDMGQCCLQDLNGNVLKTKVNIAQLKPFYSVQKLATEITSNAGADVTLEAEDEITEGITGTTETDGISSEGEEGFAVASDNAEDECIAVSAETEGLSNKGEDVAEREQLSNKCKDEAVAVDGLLNEEKGEAFAEETGHFNKGEGGMVAADGLSNKEEGGAFAAETGHFNKDESGVVASDGFSTTDEGFAAEIGRSDKGEGRAVASDGVSSNGVANLFSTTASTSTGLSTNCDVEFVAASCSSKKSIYEIRNDRLKGVRKTTRKRLCMENATALNLNVRTDRILAGYMLNNNEMNAAQLILKQQFAHVPGLQDTLLGNTLTYDVQPVEMIQIIHDGALHWLLVSTYGCKDGQVKVYDSLMSPSPALNVQLQIASLICCPLKRIECAYQLCQQQKGGADCGLFAIAFAVDLCLGLDLSTVSYEQSAMCQHLCKCFNEGLFQSFPRTEQRIQRCKGTNVSFPIYCSCRLPDNKKEKMVLCTKCKDWYHISCANIPKRFVGTDKLWNCSMCSV